MRAVAVSCRSALETKKIMLRQPEILRGLLEHITEALIVYVCHQIDSGAQVRHARQLRPDLLCTPFFVRRPSMWPTRRELQPLRMGGPGAMGFVCACARLHTRV